MKKFIISTLTLVIGVALFSTTAFAAASLNSPGQMSTVTVTNATTQPCNFGSIDGCWKSSTTAQPGDMIAVHLYFKNTGDQTATDVKLGVQPSRSGTHVTFNGGVAATNAPRATGTATVTLSQDTTITNMPQNGAYQADWYSSANGAPQPVNTDQLFGGGFPIGNLSAGQQGVLVVRFKVNGETIVTPPAQTCAINAFDANPNTIVNGNSSTLSWNTTNCQYVNITALGSTVGSNLNPTDTKVVTPNSTRTYTLTAFPGGATATRTVTVTNNDGGCTSNCGGNTNNCTINSFYVDSNSISQGQTTTLHWNTSGADSVYISGFGSRQSSGSLSISPYSSTSYSLSLSGNNCNNTSQSVYVTVNQPVVYNPGPTNNVQQPQAITTVASVLSSYSAQLNGIAVPNNTYGTASAWFEYGSSTALGNRSDAQNVTGTGTSPYSSTIGGLSGSRTYYYRAVVQNQSGIAYGAVVPFSTPSSSVYVPPVRVVHSQTVVRSANTGIVANSQASLFKLQVDSSFDHMCIGGTVDYTVTYQNISGQQLQNSILRITFPGELTYASGSRGDYSVTDRTLTIALGDVQPGEQGSVTVHAQVNSEAVQGKLAVITATIVYTNPVTRAQENAIAYSLITVSNDCPAVLGASVFGFGGFLPTTLLGWLLLILIILALIVLARMLYRKNESQRTA
ncbi:MAG: hypothetical protein ABIO57_00720 [Candidatus Paceibacterota bacterium]